MNIMLQYVIDDYLRSITEIQFFLPFIQLLEASGYFDIHLVHSPTEFGKDVIAKKSEQGEAMQYAFQLKAGDINLLKFRDELQQQLLQACTNKLAHPNLDQTLPYQVVFVTTGIVQQPASIAFQEMNRFVSESLHQKPVVTWERNHLAHEFQAVGIEPFFQLHRSPDFTARFFDFYSELKNGTELSTFSIETYTSYWLKLDPGVKENRLQVFFEAFFFSNSLWQQDRHYESVLVVSALIRFLIKFDLFEKNEDVIAEYLDLILEDFSMKFSKLIAEGKTVFTESRSEVFSIFNYPVRCSQVQELLSIHYLYSDKSTKKEQLLGLLKTEPGCHHPISDNFSMSVFLTSMALLKMREVGTLKKYINNVVIWLCNRYEHIGIAPLGSTRQEEYEQLLSEHLDGFEFQKRTSSFMASMLLDVTARIGDPKFYESIANEIRAVEIIPEFYHVNEDDALYSYSDKPIYGSADKNFSLNLVDEYSSIIEYERKNCNITKFGKPILFLMLLLRDRYFPKYVFELAT